MRQLYFATAAVMALGGCAFLKGLSESAFQKPTLSFRSASLAEASLSSATVNVVYAIENPNAIGLSLADVRYAFAVEGKQVVAGQPPAGLHIPANGTAELSFPASVKFADLASVLATFLTKDFATYRAEGEVGVKTPIGVLRFPLATEGQFEVPKIPKMELGSPRIAHLGLDGATLELPLTLTNRNSYPLPIQSFSGALHIAGAKAGSLSSGDFGQLEARGSRQVTLPLTLQFSQAGAAAQAIREGRAQITLNVQISSGGSSVPLTVSQMVSFLR
jgi:LEA14-like dessication related protein